jgi:hypothetical protein
VLTAFRIHAHGRQQLVGGDVGIEQHGAEPAVALNATDRRYASHPVAIASARHNWRILRGPRAPT